jgi:Uma2 family endonuclease
MASTNPSLIVEVLSERTEAWDRGGKFELYEQLPSLRHYVLVSQGKARIEHYARNDDGSWTRRVAGPGEAVVFEGLCALQVDAVYARVEASRVAEGEAEVGAG